ncbi:MAG: SUMF1/EgtB/PvdO family nonheme iron enzyme [Spirochaetaceae bacterium]
MKKRRQIEETLEIEDVKLKPLFGMEPGLYLTILYSILLLLVLFALLILPGIRNGGSVVEFRTEPEGAAVFMDDTYIGSTPFDRFMEAGEYSLRIQKPHFNGTGPESVDVPRRIVGSLFFPAHTRIDRNLSLEDAEAYVGDSFRNLSDWAMVGTFHERYQYPESIAQPVEVLEKENREEYIRIFLQEAAENLGSPEIVRDYMNALEELGWFDGKETLDLEIDEELMRIYRRLAGEEKISGDLMSSLEQRVGSMDFESFYSELPEPSERSEAPQLSEKIEAAGAVFVLVPGSRDAPLGNEEILSLFPEPSFEDLRVFPHREDVDSFYMAVSEVTERQYARFLEDNPKWRRSNKEELIEDGVVNTEYLLHFEGDSSVPVRWVSWYAAKAYIEWLNVEYFNKMKPEGGGYSLSARLAYEGEWEYAARFNNAGTFLDSESGDGGPRAAEFSRTGRLGIADLRGNLWEWTEGWYFPSDVLDGSYGLKAEDSESLEGVEKALRGGSWVNDLGNIPVWERGSHPPEWCTPFTGFRVVLEVDHGS